MKAVLNPEYGPPEALRVLEVARPTVSDDQILVRVRAASVNPFDWHLMRGKPRFVRLLVGLRRPSNGGFLGVDVAGTVEAVGRSVSEFAPGDEVFGSCTATFAEYTVGGEDNFVRKPANLTPEEAAALPGAGVTALQAVRDHGAVQPGQTVLINGASGGVGTFAIQIAKSLGAQVTGVCSSANIDLVRALGAHEVIDYAADDFTKRGPYDVIIDTIGNRPLAPLRHALQPGGTLVAVGGGMRRKVAVKLLNRFVKPDLTTFIAKVTKPDMTTLKELSEAGNLTPAVGRTYPLEETAEAIRYVETGHARGKVVITV
jgi:NADPH:quinone reductase-like Zn-dependent oxidoreductase